MKKIIVLIFVVTAVSSCMKKVDKIEVSNDFSTLAVINASPASAASPTNNNANVYVDGVIQTISAVAYRGASGYLSVLPGSHSISYIAPTIDSARLVERNENFEPRKAYTYVIYDTVPASQTGSARRVKSFRLTDDIGLSGKQAGGSFIRVLHLAPSASALDFTFLRTNVATPDSVTVTNRMYIGASPTQAQIDALSPFSTVLPLGFNGAYTIRVKLAGTQTVIASATANFTTQAITQSFATVYITGGAQGQPLALGLFRHYP